MRDTLQDALCRMPFAGSRLQDPVHGGHMNLIFSWPTKLKRGTLSLCSCKHARGFRTETGCYKRPRYKGGKFSSKHKGEMTHLPLSLSGYRTLSLSLSCGYHLPIVSWCELDQPCKTTGIFWAENAQCDSVWLSEHARAEGLWLFY